MHTIVCVFVAKKVITYDKCTDTHYKMTIFYMFICRFYLFIHISFHLEAYMCYKYETNIQINLRTPNPRQIIAAIRRNADGRVHVEQPLVLNWST